MKAVSLTFEYRGDDQFHHRLLFFLKEHVSSRVESVVPIKKDVFFVRINGKQRLIVKGFSSKQALVTQEHFTQSLKSHHFPYTYSFYSHSEQHPLYFEEKYYGCMEYIHKGRPSFHYRSKANCEEALTLLKKFHHTTERIANEYESRLPSFDLLQRWKRRYFLFLKYKKFVQRFIAAKELDELTSWAETALAGIEKEKGFYDQLPPVILHGDVANHNFIRTAEGSLYLIDYDLISIGPAICDDIQFCHRVLPFLQWSNEALTTFQELRPYWQEKFFLYALLFPTDVFREWNRLFMEQSYHDQQKIEKVTALTMNRLELRKAFYRSVMQRIYV